MRVLVTGGAGYIGSHTAKALAQQGIEPVVFDNLSIGNRQAVKWGPLVIGDLGDRDSICEALTAHRIEAVIHFAAYAYVGESVGNPRKYFQNNVANALHLIDAMLDAGVSRLIFSSSCATYGIPASALISEDDGQHPVNPYGESKLFIERAIRYYGEAYGMQWVALRYFNAAGADPDGEIGENHTPETHLIPLTIQAALGGPPLRVFGTDYPTPDGTAIRDYIHVADLAQAHVKALGYLAAGHPSKPFNLGTGQGYSVREVVSTVERITGRTVAVQDAPRRSGDPPVLVADASRAIRALAWQPRFSSLETICETAFHWQANIKRSKGHAAA
jgi:UDP-arabinose 4-epimerase